MSTYISLMKFTEQGAKEIKDAPKRVEQFVKSLEAMGGKLIGIYMVMGEYDYVGIAELPSDEVALSYLMNMGAAGMVKTTTLRAFKKEEFISIMNKLP